MLGIHHDLLIEIDTLSVEVLSENSSFKIIEEVSFSIKRGEMVGMIGSSGSGKSTLALAMLRLVNNPLNITGGTILYYTSSQPINLLTLTEKDGCNYRGKEIALIFQDPKASLNPVVTCGNQLAETICLHKKCSYKVAKQQTLALLKEVGLSDSERFFYAYPHQLSGGQLQRVVIALAISCSPTLLIADEPTSALDAENETLILNLLQKLNQKYNLCILLISHSLPIIANYCDRLLVLQKGKIIEQGNTQQVFTHPQHPHTKQLLTSRFLKGTAYPLKIPLTNPSPLLTVRSLKKYFPAKQALFSLSKKKIKAVDDVSFTIYQGEIVGLVGKSGCGKTTLAKIILGLVKPSWGEVWFNDHNMLSPDDEKRLTVGKHIQVVFQNPFSSLNPNHTIGETITEPMHVHKMYSSEKERKSKAIELLEKVHLHAHVYHRYPHELSGGEVQRIAIARALALNPSLIIYDEPFSSLDSITQSNIITMLLQLKNELNLTYLFIAHDDNLLASFCDRIITMKEGRLI
jgi:peptide/nickel transport system ATP-binding protein